MEVVNNASVPSAFGMAEERRGADKSTSGVNFFARIVIFDVIENWEAVESRQVFADFVSQVIDGEMTNSQELNLLELPLKCARRATPLNVRPA